MSLIENGPIPDGWRLLELKFWRILEDVWDSAGWWVWAGRSPAGSMAVVVGLQVAHGAGEEQGWEDHTGPHRATREDHTAPPRAIGARSNSRTVPTAPAVKPLTIQHQPNPKKASALNIFSSKPISLYMAQDVF